MPGESFKKLSEELASFADYVSEQSWRMRSDLRAEGPQHAPQQAQQALQAPQAPQALGPQDPPACSAGALPRQEADMSCLAAGCWEGGNKGKQGRSR